MRLCRVMNEVLTTSQLNAETEVYKLTCRLARCAVHLGAVFRDANKSAIPQNTTKMHCTPRYYQTSGATSEWGIMFSFKDQIAYAQLISILFFGFFYF